jgi:hypothetical protein
MSCIRALNQQKFLPLSHGQSAKRVILKPEVKNESQKEPRTVRKNTQPGLKNKAWRETVDIYQSVTSKLADNNIYHIVLIDKSLIS